MDEKLIPIIEMFGPVIQGEGSMAGSQTLFLRTGGCDYDCSWCDTKYAVEPEQVKRNKTDMTEKEILEALTKLSLETGCKTVTLSGGNPAMWDLSWLVEKLRERCWRIAVETQGSIWRNWLRDVTVLTVSPKPPSSGMKVDSSKLDYFLRSASLGPEVCLKIVVFDRADFEWAKGIFTAYRDYSDSFYLQTGSDLQVKNLTKDILERTRNLIKLVTEDPKLYYVKVMPQLHTLLYGDVRGV